MKLDCHIHSDLSPDSPMKPETILKTAQKRGLDGVVIANHNRSLPQSVLDLFADSPVYLIPAVEYSTDAGHVLALFWTDTPENHGVYRENSVYDHREILRLVRAGQGLAILAHPFGSSDPTPEILASFDGIEAANSRVSYRRKGLANVKSRAAAENAPLYTAGSDAHLAWEIGRSYVTLPLEKPYTREAIVEALKTRPPVTSRPTHPCTLSISQIYKGASTKKIRLLLKSCLTLLARTALVFPRLFGITPYERQDI